MLKVNNASYLYSASPRKGFEAVSFSLKERSCISILGKSGSGKSTLLKCMAGLLDVQSGEISLDGTRVTGPNFNLIPGNKHIKYVAQDFDLNPDYTAFENIKDHLDYNYTPTQKEKITNKLITLFDLKDVAKHLPRQLSGGQQQRVAIASCLAEMPKLILLDEPFNDLDYSTKSKTIALLKNACKEYTTSIILVTHNYEEAFALSDFTMLMSRGKIIQKGKNEDVFFNPKTLALAGLMGDYGVLKAGEQIANDFTEKPTVVRPAQIIVSNKPSKQAIQLSITSCEFMGNYYKCSGKTVLGSELILHHTAPLEQAIYIEIAH